MMIRIIKYILKYIYSTYLRIKLRTKNIIIDKNVSFLNAKLYGYNKIYKNTNINNTEIGTFSYIGHNAILNNCIIGNFCSIAPYAEVIYGRHPIDKVSTHPLFYSTRKQCGINIVNENLYEEFNYIGEKKKSVIIENDVWIGYNVKIIEGVTIRNGSIILAGSIVTKNVEEYSIVGGVPAKHIKYRFEKKIIKELLRIQWWEKDIKWIKENKDHFLSVYKFINAQTDKVENNDY